MIHVLALTCVYTVYSISNYLYIEGKTKTEPQSEVQHSLVHLVYNSVDV